MTHKKYYCYLSLLVCIIFSLILGIYQIRPFGNNTLLTMDLGNQYIDFFHFYRHSLLNGSILTYSFQKGLGGNMVGIWAYYLMSPFNLFFLFVEDKQIPDMIIIITGLKMIATSWTSFHYFTRRFRLLPHQAITLSLYYTFMPFTLVNISNLMWLDSLILLPCICLGLYKLIHHNQSLWLVVCLTLAWVIQFYLTYMTVIFLYLLLLIEFIWKEKTFNLHRIIKCYKVLSWSILQSILLASCTLIPTLDHLLTSKISLLSPGFDGNVPFNITQILSQIFIGNFTFSYFKDGPPLLYIGIIPLMLLFSFFISKRHLPLLKWIIGWIYLLYFLSLCMPQLTQLWHGGSLPNWYPHRHIFTMNFFNFIIIAYDLSHQSKSIHTPSKSKLTSILIIISSLILFINQDRMLMGILHIMILLQFLLLQHVKITHFHLKEWYVLLLSITNIILVNTIIFSEINMIDQNTYNAYNNSLKKLNTHLDIKNKHTLSRIHSQFYRSPNESFTFRQNTLTHFSSLLDQSSQKLMKIWGQESDHAYIRYNHPHPFLDDFLRIEYTLRLANHPVNHKEAVRQGFNHIDSVDLYNHLKPTKTVDSFNIYHNTNLLPIGMEVTNNILSSPFKLQEDNPQHNLTVLLNYLDYKNLFTIKELQDMSHLPSQNQLSKAESLALLYPTYHEFRQAYRHSHQHQFINKHSKWITEMTIEQEEAAVLFSIPYDKHWQVYINQKRVPTVPVYNQTLMAVPIEKGHHTVALQYNNSSIYYGRILSIIGIIVLFVTTIKQKYTSYSPYKGGF